MNDHNRYPLGNANGQIVGCGNSVNPTPCEWGQEWGNEKVTYMKKLPSDPTPGGAEYFYVSDGRAWQLYARLERQDDKDLNDANDSGSYENESDDFSYSCGSEKCNFGVASSNTSLDKELETEQSTGDDNEMTREEMARQEMLRQEEQIREEMENEVNTWMEEWNRENL